MRVLLRRILLATLVAAAGLLALAIALPTFGTAATQILLTTLGIAMAALILDVGLGLLSRHPRLTTVALVALLLSQAAFHLLVWTAWKADPLLWRAWWSVTFACVTMVYVLLLKATSPDTPDMVDRSTPIAAAFLGFLIITLAFRRDVPPQVGPVFTTIATVPAFGTIIGSLIVLRRRALRPAAPYALPRRIKIALVLASHVVLFLIGLYIGDRLPKHSNPFEFLPSALAGMDPADVDRQVQADLQRLRKVTRGLDEIRASAAVMHDTFLERMNREGRFYFTPEEDDRVRWHFVTYLSYRAALLRLVATYASFEAVPDPDTKARCFLVGYAAAVTAYDAALALVESYGRNSVARRKLNEPEPVWDLPSGMYDRIYESITNSRNYEMALEMSAYYTHHLPAWRQAGVFPEDDLDWLSSRIETCFESVRTRIPARSLARLDLLLERVKEDAYTPVYAAQSILSEWIGDTRIVECKPLIALEQIDGIAPRLRPGDIILERRNWFLSNAFLPGFWPHGALYVGSPEDLKDLGILDDPDIQARLPEFESLAEDGEPHRIIEAVSDGVIFSSLGHSMHADHVAVLRPRLEKDQIASAIARAFRHHGKPYDFEFDFFTSDKLVCTELIYRAYEGMIDFDLVRVMGRDTLPAIEIVRKFARERSRPDRDLDFILFLDGSPSTGDASLSSEDDFCQSADRPRAFHK